MRIFAPKINRCVILFLCVLAQCTWTMAENKNVPGVVRVMRMIGVVTVKDETTGESKPLTAGDVLSEKYTVTTGASSTVVLLFSNGSTILLKPDTEVSIAKFLQKPFEASVDYISQLEVEPSVSNTTLKVNYGTMVGSIKQLKINEGSTYDLDTPIGIAGIRGTMFSLMVNNSECTLEVAQGDMFFIPSQGSGSQPYISVQTKQVANINLDGIKVNPLPNDRADQIQNDSIDASSGFGTIPAPYFEPNPNNSVSIGTQPPAPAPSTADTPTTPPPPAQNTPTIGSQNNDVPQTQSPPIQAPAPTPTDPGLIVPVALPPPASPVGGS